MRFVVPIILASVVSASPYLNNACQYLTATTIDCTGDTAAEWTSAGSFIKGASFVISNWYVTSDCDLQSDTLNYKFTASGASVRDCPFVRSSVRSAAIALKIAGRTAGSTDIIVKDGTNVNSWLWTLSIGNGDTFLTSVIGRNLILEGDIFGGSRLVIDSVVAFNQVATTPPPTTSAASTPASTTAPATTTAATTRPPTTAAPTTAAATTTAAHTTSAASTTRAPTTSAASTTRAPATTFDFTTARASLSGTVRAVGMGLISVLAAVVFM